MTLYGGKTLDELEALANAATEGPWGLKWQEHSDFIAASRTAIPALIARIKELEMRIANTYVNKYGVLRCVPESEREDDN